MIAYSVLPLGRRYLSRKLPTIAVASKDAGSVVPKSSSLEADPGNVPGTLLKILKYPHPKVGLCAYYMGVPFLPYGELCHACAVAVEDQE